MVVDPNLGETTADTEPEGTQESPNDEDLTTWYTIGDGGGRR
jgi:hypothetical protein